jgi:hypothetical protein
MDTSWVVVLAVAAAVAVIAAGLWLRGAARRRARVAGMVGKVAIITGASSGIGRALAIRLAARGVDSRGPSSRSAAA